MSRESIVILLGLLVFFAPHIGIPEEWRLIIVSAAGAVLIVLGYGLRRSAFRRRLARSQNEHGTDSFTEYQSDTLSGNTSS